MTAREAMQALLDGKTLRKDGVVITPAVWGLLMKFNNGTCERITLEDCEVVDEYPLTFEQALRAMLDGKVVEVERLDFIPRFSYRFNRELSCFEFYSTSDDKWWMTHISECEQSCKWKVVE